MTLVIAAQGTDFLILGADSRGTMQDIARNRLQINLMIKLHKITDHVGFLVYGSGAQAFFLIERFKKQITNPHANVSKIFDDFIKFCRSEFRKLKDVPIGELPSFGFIIAGLDKSSSSVIPHCYTSHSNTGFIPGVAQHGYEIKGKPIIAEYLFAKHYNQNKSVDELCELVALAMNDTINIDGDVGGQVHMAIIDKDGFREYSEDDVESFINPGNHT